MQTLNEAGWPSFIKINALRVHFLNVPSRPARATGRETTRLL